MSFLHHSEIIINITGREVPQSLADASFVTDFA